MTNNQIKPCHCGHQGELHGGHFCGCLTLTCPGCAREVQAFTVVGLIDAWNKRPVSDEQDGPAECTNEDARSFGAPAQTEPVANWSCSECGATSGEACNANGCFLNEAAPAEPAPAQTEQQPVGVVDRLSVVAGKTTAYFDGRVCPIGTKLYAAPIVQTEQQQQQQQQPKRDREADRARFPDPAFNKWLDEGISDSGHTVWDQVNVYDAWAGWESRPFYTTPIAQSRPAEWRRVVERLIANVEILDQRPRPMCRDCADRDGICESGLDCDVRALVKEARAMIASWGR